MSQRNRRFRDQLEAGTADVWHAIDALPFLAELESGVLDQRKFAYFITEDMMYLNQFARVLAKAAAWADDAEVQRLYLQRAQNALNVEQSLHRTLARQLGLNPPIPAQCDPAPVTLAYTDHLLKVAYAGPLTEICAAVLPCYWVYGRVGDRLAADPPAHPVYGPWIAAYASAEFQAAVEAQLSLIDRLASDASPATIERMERWFRRSLRYEWMFWNQAYDEEAWPIPIATHDAV